MSLKSARFVSGMLVLSMSLGCAVFRPVEVKRETLVGDYVLGSDEPSDRCDPDRLTLRADGSYTLTHMPNGRPGPQERGTWRLLHEPPDEVLVGDTGFPIELKGNRVRLMANYDRGEYYEKTR